MAMKLERLEKLNTNMKQQGMIKTKFEFKFRKLTFSVIYIAEKLPYELLFGCRAQNLFFVVKVEQGFMVDTYLGNAYRTLCQALELKPNPDNKFSSNVFFKDFSTIIPINTSPNNIPTITEIALNSRDVEDSQKVYFLGWLSHDGVQSKPSEANLLKTKRICGQATYDICRRNYISSRWTDIKERAQQYKEPTI